MRVELRLQTGVFLGFLLAASVAAMSQTKPGQAQSAPDTIESRFGEVDGIKIHYLTAGHGPAVILLHGYTQTSRMWRPLIPKLTDKFTVVAPDLPGIGDSDIPKDGLDMKTAAMRIHALAKSLGISKARVVGHDIGLMVAYAYAAQFPSEVEKLAVMDAFLPGVPGWELAYDSPNFWHFRFHGPTPEALVQGREKIYFAYFWNDLAADGTRSLSEADRTSYVAAYSRPGRMRAGWAYFASWPDTAKDFAQMAQTQLTMPVLSIAGEKASAAILSPQMKRVATDVKVIEKKAAGIGSWKSDLRRLWTRSSSFSELKHHQRGEFALQPIRRPVDEKDFVVC